MKKYSIQFLLILSICFALVSMAIINKNNPSYNKLNDYLNTYEIIKKKGGWPKIKTAQLLKIGMCFPEIKSIKKRLSITGEYTDAIEHATDTFDVKLEKAVITFQRNHNLKTTGIVDGKTLRELNTGVDYRIHQIMTNMKRWKNFSGQFEDNYILVNIAAGNLDLIKNDTVQMNMKVIVGRYYRQTPVFSSNVTMIDFNPYWVIPPGIFEKDILPKLRANPDYLMDRDMYVTQNNKVVSHDINWKTIDPKSNPYKIVQKPGIENPLGVIKFVFPNKYIVYMHDTPDKKLFEANRFGFSSGCIRLSKAVELGEHILKRDQNWSRLKIDSIIARERNHKVMLLNPVKIYICYFTSWVSRDGSLQFAPDIYYRD